MQILISPVELIYKNVNEWIDLALWHCKLLMVPSEGETTHKSNLSSILWSSCILHST